MPATPGASAPEQIAAMGCSYRSRGMFPVCQDDAPPMLIWHSSNRLESLAEILAAEMAADPLPPLQQEQVLVGSVGIGRWLSLRLADHLGICAQVDFPLPGRFIWALWSALLGGCRSSRPLRCRCCAGVSMIC